jgi:hypothetical protein
MKKSFFAFLAVCIGLVALVSCSTDSAPSVNFHLSYIVADSVDVPEIMVRGQKYPITVYYKRPDNCHYFNGIYRNDANGAVTVAIEAMVLNNVNCEPIQAATPDVASFEYTVPMSVYSTCKFKFYNGVNSYGQDTFIIKDVPVAP